MPIERILVPVEYSEHCHRVLAYALFLAERLGASVDVLHVWDRPAYVPDTIMVGKAGEATRSLAELIRDNAEQEMTEFLAGSTVAPTLTLTHHLESGEPASTILRFAQSSGADLVVMGTHARGAVRHLLLGSVAEKVVRMSPVPVITLPPVNAD